MKYKKSILAMLIVLVVLLGCSSKGDEAGDRTVIRFATWDSEENLSWQEDLVNEYKDSQEEIFVKLEAYGSEYDTKLAAGFGAGDAPDVLYMWNFPKYYEALMPLDDFLDSNQLRDKYYDALWNYNAIDGVTYGVPVGFSTHVVYYNKDLFKQAGIEEPVGDWDWTEFRTAAEKISELGDDIYGLGIPVKPDPYDFEMYLWSNDTSFSDDNGKLEGNLDSDKAVATYEMFQNMIKDGSAMATEGSGSTEMATGNLGMFIYGSWSIGKLTEEGINFGLAKLPNMNQEAVSILSSSGLSVAKDTKEPDAAFKFLEFWTGKRAVEVRLTHELPPLIEVVEESGVMEDETKSMFYEMLEQSDGYTPSSFKVDGWSEISQDIQEALERILNPHTLEDAKDVMTEILSRR